MISNIWLGNTLFSKYRIIMIKQYQKEEIKCSDNGRTRKDIFGITFVINYINSKLKMSNVSSSLIRNTVYKLSKTEICMLICSKKTGLSYDSTSKRTLTYICHKTCKVATFIGYGFNVYDTMM